MATVETILLRVRDILGDPDKTRWTDDSLIRRLNEGLVDIAKKTEVFKDSISIQIVKGKHFYELPDDFVLIKGVLFAQEPLPVYSAQQMVRLFGNDWRMHTTTSEPLACITDRQDAKTIRIYPRPYIDDLYDLYNFTPDPYGIEDAITDYVFDTNVGLIGDIFDINLLDVDLDTFGIIADALEGDFITIEYIRRPIEITTINQTPELPPAYNTALVRYIAGTALRDDTDTQNRAMGNEELIIYQNELNDIKSMGLHSNTSAAHNNTSEYRGMGE
jgi:hypothetical protein